MSSQNSGATPEWLKITGNTPVDKQSWSEIPTSLFDRPRLGDDPAGHICAKCEKRPATMIWGDFMTVNHGGGEWRCDICALTEQLEHARERAKVIPELERKLAILMGRELFEEKQL